MEDGPKLPEGATPELVEAVARALESWRGRRQGRVRSAAKHAASIENLKRARAAKAERRRRAGQRSGEVESG